MTGLAQGWARISAVIGLAVVSGMAAEAAAQAGREPMQVPLRYSTRDNMAIAGGLLRLQYKYKQADNRALSFEAEKATVLSLQNADRRIRKSDECSGGAYVEHVRRMAFHFRADRPGDYRVWLRCWFPKRANYNHNERMDDGPVHNVVDSLNEPAKRWRWVKGRVYTLAGPSDERPDGRHRYQFPAPTAFAGGARLDKIVLMPVGAGPPSGIGPSPSPSLTPRQAEAVTRPTKLDGVQAWRLKHDAEANHGHVRVQYRYDDHDWQDLPQGEHEGFVDLPEPRPEHIVFRFTIRGRENGPAPSIAGVRLFVIKAQTSSTYCPHRF